jgi:hypothetical protein
MHTHACIVRSEPVVFPERREHILYVRIIQRRSYLQSTSSSAWLASSRGVSKFLAAPASQHSPHAPSSAAPPSPVVPCPPSRSVSAALRSRLISSPLRHRSYYYCNIVIVTYAIFRSTFCNIQMKHLQYTSKTAETFGTYTYNIRLKIVETFGIYPCNKRA